MQITLEVSFSGSFASDDRLGINFFELRNILLQHNSLKFNPSGDFVVTARVRSSTGRYCFHECLSVHIREGTPSRSHSTSTGPMSLLGVRGTAVTGPRSLPGDYPSDWSHVHSRLVPQSQMDYPQPGMGYPLAR